MAKDKFLADYYSDDAASKNNYIPSLSSYFSKNSQNIFSTNSLLPIANNKSCGSSSDCGAGFYCNQGRCVPAGQGNTFNISVSAGNLGCSSGPDGTKNCGNTSGSGNLGGCYAAGCGEGNNVGLCGGGTGDDGQVCCRYGATGTVTCTSGECPEIPECSSYCSGEYASYGTREGECSEYNTCSECTVCSEDNRCVPKEDAPCHCFPERNDSCDRPPIYLTCCNYRDTCAGRIPGLYCHDTFRTYFPRCWDPEYTCDGTDEECTYICTSYSGPEIPQEVLDDENCEQVGEIINEETGETIYLWKCCEPNLENPKCCECEENIDCPKEKPKCDGCRCQPKPISNKCVDIYADPNEILPPGEAFLGANGGLKQEGAWAILSPCFTWLVLFQPGYNLVRETDKTNPACASYNFDLEENKVQPAYYTRELDYPDFYKISTGFQTKEGYENMGSGYLNHEKQFGEEDLYGTSTWYELENLENPSTSYGAVPYAWSQTVGSVWTNCAKFEIEKSHLLVTYPIALSPTFNTEEEPPEFQYSWLREPIQ